MYATFFALFATDIFMFAAVTLTKISLTIYSKRVKIGPAATAVQKIWRYFAVPVKKPVKKPNIIIQCFLVSTTSILNVLALLLIISIVHICGHARLVLPKIFLWALLITRILVLLCKIKNFHLGIIFRCPPVFVLVLCSII